MAVNNNKPYKTYRGGKPSLAEEVLKMVLRKKGLDKKLDDYRFIPYWKEIVGEKLAKKTRPQCIKNGSLVVNVVNSTWAQELSFHKEVILENLAPYLSKDQIVREVRFTIG